MVTHDELLSNQNMPNEKPNGDELTEETSHLSRRKILGAASTIGAAGAFGGVGTMAFFSDEEQFANNQLTAGELDMKVGWEEHYSDWSEDEAEHAHMENGDLVIDDHEGFMDATFQERFPDKETKKLLDEGTADPCDVLADVPDDLEKPVIDLSDVKPGDFGWVFFDFVLCDNPGWMWMTGDLIENAENGLIEPEQESPDEVDTDIGNLLDLVQVELWYDTDCNSILESGNPPHLESGGDVPFFQGSLFWALRVLSSRAGWPLDGDLTNQTGNTLDYTKTNAFTENSRHCLGIRWEVPRTVGNEIQTDRLQFDLGFYTEQRRHQTPPGHPTGVGTDDDDDEDIPTPTADPLPPGIERDEDDGFQWTGDCQEELVIYIHGFDQTPARSQTKADEMEENLRNEGYNGEFWGYRWASNPAGSGIPIHDAWQKWHRAKEFADAAGELLAAILETYCECCPDTDIHLVAHSLGARVALEAVENLTGPLDCIKTVHLMGAAVPNSSVNKIGGDYFTDIVAKTDQTYNYHSFADDVLDSAYQAAEGTQALGDTGATGDTPNNYHDSDVTDEVGDEHSGYSDNVSDDIVDNMGN